MSDQPLLPSNAPLDAVPLPAIEGRSALHQGKFWSSQTQAPVVLCRAPVTPGLPPNAACPKATTNLLSSASNHSPSDTHDEINRANRRYSVACQIVACCRSHPAFPQIRHGRSAQTTSLTHLRQARRSKTVHNFHGPGAQQARRIIFRRARRSCNSFKYPGHPSV